jgi:hypothetical protein
MTHAMRKYTSIRPVVMKGSPDAHNVFLIVGGQAFKVTPFACDTKCDAEWMQDQLCMALAKIVENERVTI